ncbi:MAG: rod shape-determining protein MreD [Ruminococcus sp.]|nr:rod shape-determining protein MreD [Ruminococcus sp.]MBR6599088.1 rod shape-determining protein MreD [Oscillospiraceae bacterium]
MDIRHLSARRKRKFAIIRWIIFILLIWFVFIFTTTGNFIKPNLLIPLALCICVREDALVSAILGISCGFLIDTAFGKIDGYNAIILMIGCVCTSLLFTHLLRETFINITVITLLYSAIHFFLDYFFYYMIWEYEQNNVILYKYVIPEFVLTSVSLFLIYPLVKLIRNHFTLRKMHTLNENQALIKD